MLNQQRKEHTYHHKVSSQTILPVWALILSSLICDKTHLIQYYGWVADPVNKHQSLMFEIATGGSLKNKPKENLNCKSIATQIAQG